MFTKQKKYYSTKENEEKTNIPLNLFQEIFC